MDSSGYERELRVRLSEAGFLVTRAGGSLGIDLLAVCGRSVHPILPIEVKSSHNPVHHTSHNSGRETEQYNRSIAECRRAGVRDVLVAYRLVGRARNGWRIFDRPTRTTPKGHYVFEWEKGVPLDEYLRKLLL